jgi:Skp family chaperone for outer membrane proteins
MRQLVKAAAIVAGMMAFSGIGFAQCKIVVVDMQEAVTGSNEGKEKAAKFDARVKEWTDKLDKIKADIDGNQKKLQAQQALASQAVLQALNKSITDKQTELTRTSEDAQKDVDGYRDELLGPVMEVAQKTMNDLATEKGYSIVYDLSAPNSPIVYSSKDCNITEEIKNRLNAKGATPVSTSAPARGASPASATPAASRGATAPAATTPAGRGATTPATTAPAAGRGETTPAATPPAPAKP